MSAIRAGHHFGEDGFLVFDNGTLLEYPRFSKASNGFIRGPKGEKIGRGPGAENDAIALCRDVINNWITQFDKHGYKFVGVTAPLKLKMEWEVGVTRHRSDWVKGTNPDSLTVLVKAYYQDSPDTWDLFKVSLSPSSYRGGSSSELVRKTAVYRPSVAHPEGRLRDTDGHVTEYAFNDEIAWERIARSTGGTRDAVTAFRDQLNQAEELVKTSYVKAEWSHDLTKLYETIEDYLDIKDVIGKISPLLSELAELYSKLGEWVTIQNLTLGDGDIVACLRVDVDEHTLMLHPKGTRYTCHYERDEDRLNQLKKDRLQAELLQLHNEFGDIRQHDEQ